MANLFDADNAPKEVPKSIVIGDLVQFKLTQFSTDYPNTSHSMKFMARSGTGANVEFSIDASNSGDDYLFSASSNATSAFTAGLYHYQIEVLETSSNNRRILDQGELDVTVDLDVNAVDPRTHDEKMLQKIEAVLENRADADVSSYSIAGRSLTKMSPEELLTWRDYYRRGVKAYRRKLDVKHGRKTSSSILVRF
tara:strand:+ start:230 stop:814 length:585 start_codon:yes stop_codon:yes gene_type:complete